MLLYYNLEQLLELLRVIPILQRSWICRSNQNWQDISHEDKENRRGTGLKKQVSRAFQSCQGRVWCSVQHEAEKATFRGTDWQLGALNCILNNYTANIRKKCVYYAGLQYAYCQRQSPWTSCSVSGPMCGTFWSCYQGFLLSVNLRTIHLVQHCLCIKVFIRKGNIQEITEDWVLWRT